MTYKKPPKRYVQTYWLCFYAWLCTSSLTEKMTTEK